MLVLYIYLVSVNQLVVNCGTFNDLRTKCFTKIDIFF